MASTTCLSRPELDHPTGKHSDDDGVVDYAQMERDVEELLWLLKNRNPRLGTWVQAIAHVGGRVYAQLGNALGK